MVISALSDLTRSLMFQRQGREVRAELDRAGKEATTGLVSDVRGHLQGDIGVVFGIDRALERIEAQKVGLAVAENRASVAQQKLSVLADIADETGLNLIGAVDRGDPVSIELYAAEARTDLDMIHAALNASFGGYQLFSGAAMDTPPLAGTDVVVGDVRAIIEASPDASTALAAIDAYFASGGGFETNVYQGSTTGAPAVELSAGVHVDYLPRADEDAVRQLIKGLAISVALSEGATTASDAMRSDLFGASGSGISGSKEGVVELAARLGIAEQQIGDATARLSGERDRLQIGRNNLIGKDVYDAATEFAALEQQLQSVFAVTARTASLRLTNFLR
jgi:flagellar hook-associated protein 3 FlgL